MCKFFSFCSDEFGKKYYFDWEQRKEMKFDNTDSHDHIISFYNLKDAEINCFEYNPLTRKFDVDKINTIDNRVQAEQWVNNLDFKKVVEPLIIKEIFMPLKGRAKNPSDKQILLLKDWASVGDSVWDSVRDSVWASVWDSVRDSVWDSVRDSVWASVYGYISSFFAIPYKYDFTTAIKLWESGFVPSFDGKTWRLHSGKSAKIVYEWTPEK